MQDRIFVLYSLISLKAVVPLRLCCFWLVVPTISTRQNVLWYSVGKKKPPRLVLFFIIVLKNSSCCCCNGCF